MLPGYRKPRLSVDVNEAVAPPSSYVPTGRMDGAHQKQGHLSISVFRSHQMEIHVHSSSVKTMNRHGFEKSRTMPVYGDHDTVEGVVLLDSNLCSLPGRLTVSLEGVFIYISPSANAHEGTTFGSPTEEYRHQFFSSSLSFASGESVAPRSATSIREAFANTVRPRRMDRRPSLPELSSTTRGQFPFSFEIPRPTRQGEEIPPSCSAMAVGEVGSRGRTCVERAEIEYRVIATWEGNDPSDRRRMEAPIAVQPETDFQSLDGLSLEPESWLEIPLRSDRPIPFKCAVTLPDPFTFSRAASLPFFVVFTTKPRSALLAREIAADATVTVSLIRQVQVFWSPPPSHSPTSSYSSSGEESDAPPTARRRLLNKVVKSAPPAFNSSSPYPESKRPRLAVKDKPLPPIPPGARGISDTRTLRTDVSIGFPKRPRNRVQPHQRHPSLDAHSSLPDGLYKGKLQLGKNMLPGIEWGGLSVKYFVEVSVLFGQDEVRARVPVRII